MKPKGDILKLPYLRLRFTRSINTRGASCGALVYRMEKNEWMILPIERILGSCVSGRLIMSSPDLPLRFHLVSINFPRTWGVPALAGYFNPSRLRAFNPI